MDSSNDKNIDNDDRNDDTFINSKLYFLSVSYVKVTSSKSKWKNMEMRYFYFMLDSSILPSLIYQESQLPEITLELNFDSLTHKSSFLTHWTLGYLISSIAPPKYLITIFITNVSKITLTFSVKSNAKKLAWKNVNFGALLCFYININECHSNVSTLILMSVSLLHNRDKHTLEWIRTLIKDWEYDKNF